MFGDREIHRKLSGAGGYAAERLAEISDSLGQLAKIMKNSGEDPGLSREDGIAALESAASMVCGSCDRCGMKQECLDEQDGEHYFLYYLLRAFEKKGALEYPDMPREFLDRCRKKTDYLRELNRSLGRSTMNLAWKNRFLESRDAVMLQFEEMAGILGEFSGQMEQAADSARQSALAGAQDNFGNSMPGMPDASSGIQPGPADSASGKSTDETYVPSADDEYYEKITDAIRDDLPYGVEWQECDLSRKQEDASFYALYPKLTGEIRNRDYLNEIIEKQALLYKNYCQMYVEQAGFDSCHIQCFGYVTNMDSEHLSVVFDQKFYLNNQSMPGLSAINIDVETGTILKKEQQFNYSTRLAERFRKQCQKQNGLELSENEWSTEMLRKLLSSDGGIFFYTPVGLEIGFNYNGVNNQFGWMTATIKDYEEYLKKM